MSRSVKRSDRRVRRRSCSDRARAWRRARSLVPPLKAKRAAPGSKRRRDICVGRLQTRRRLLQPRQKRIGFQHTEGAGRDCLVHIRQLLAVRRRDRFKGAAVTPQNVEKQDENRISHFVGPLISVCHAFQDSFSLSLMNPLVRRSSCGCDAAVRAETQEAR